MDDFETLIYKINLIHPGIYANLEHLDQLSDDAALEIMREIAGCACHATNMGNIGAGRKLFMVIPKSLIVAHHEAIAESIDLNDEWDYRRWVELLGMIAPELIRRYLEIGHRSTDDGIREAANDYEEGTLNPYIYYLFRLKDHWPTKDGIGLLPGIPQHLLNEHGIGKICPGETLLFVGPNGEHRRLPLSTFSIRVPRDMDDPDQMKQLPLIPIVPEHDTNAISPIGSLVFWELEYKRSQQNERTTMDS